MWMYSAPACGCGHDGDMDLVIGRKAGDLKLLREHGQCIPCQLHEKRWANPFDGVADVD